MSFGDELRLRPETAADAGAIRSLIFRVGINPRGLDWRRFQVAVDPGGRLVGCGQVKPHADGSRELASIAVPPKGRIDGAFGWRRMRAGGWRAAGRSSPTPMDRANWLRSPSAPRSAGAVW